MIAPGICGSLTVIFNACLKEGCNLEEWKSANITPVHKGGLPQITDQSPCFQLLLRFLRGLSTSSFWTIYRILDPAQFGFRPEHSTRDALVNLVEDWRDALDKDMLVGSVFIDLSKAFEMINHRNGVEKAGEVWNSRCGITMV